MSSVQRTRKNFLGETQPSGADIQVKYLVTELMPIYNLRPVYQRNIRWKPSAMNSFIDTIMHNRYVQPVLLYKLHPDDKLDTSSPQRFEVMDGQHRLFTLAAFRSSSYQILPHIAKEFIVYWQFEETTESGDKNYQCVFYQKTDDVEDWCRLQKKTAHFLTEEEKADFDEYTIRIVTIQKPLSVDERRNIFMSLQNGIPVRNSDYLKNMTDCGLISFFTHNNYNEMMGDIFLPHCTRKMKDYWVQWATRCFGLFTRSKSSSEKRHPSEFFLVSDSQLSKQIKQNAKILNPSTETLDQFDGTFRRFIGFLQHTNSVKLNPTKMFALFYYLCDDKIDHDILQTHMPYFSVPDKNTSLWESSESEPRRVYFRECLEELEEMTEEARPIDDRPISRELRQQVWEKSLDSKCMICRDTELTMDSFESGHIVAKARGGPTELQNLIPICGGCNKGMGTRHAYKYQKDVYPDNV